MEASRKNQGFSMEEFAAKVCLLSEKELVRLQSALSVVKLSGDSQMISTDLFNPFMLQFFPLSVLKASKLERSELLANCLEFIAKRLRLVFHYHHNWRFIEGNTRGFLSPSCAFRSASLVFHLDERAHAFHSAGDFLVFSPSDNSFRFLAAASEKNKPIHRWSHSLAQFTRDFLVIYGGVNSKRFFSDVHFFHVPSRSWTPTTVEENQNLSHEAPFLHGTTLLEWNKRGGDSLAGDRHVLVVFGGATNHPNGGCYAFQNQLWFCEPTIASSGSISVRWNLQQTTGDDLPNLAFHSGIIHNDNLFVYGGYNSTGSQNTLYRVHLPTLIVQTVVVSGKIPNRHAGYVKRAYSIQSTPGRICLWNSGSSSPKLVLFGSQKKKAVALSRKVYIFDLSTNVWSRLKTRNAPGDTFQHPNVHCCGDKLLVLGGTAPYSCVLELQSSAEDLFFENLVRSISSSTLSDADVICCK